MVLIENNQEDDVPGYFFFIFCFFGVFGHQCLSSPGLYPFEALAEISDFVAGLVQRVPKKPNEMKDDLLNSTARLWKQNASATKIPHS
ncbi:hypothetical protein HMPREF9225_1986 [Peptoniphilus duerdenii ATCC BAA-1640]|uniref:Uncharacterized protein n=1 Tax=Peptoniphilus duerdenii ATCC BAA-1640 TaxID=862517 RepID=E0NP97_9FIRM|nr:hypothetical protein HMPREF9225_1986 [Peptoniphilus duerdenii ATCC BAA-1640]